MELEKIPQIFWSDLSQEPFSSCINCNNDLIRSGQFYIIEKAVKGFQKGHIDATVFEYAMCLSCAENLRAELSETSKRNIEQFYAESVNFSKRAQELKDQDKSAWLEKCLIDNEVVSENGECQLFALCQGDYLVYQEFPYMIRAEAMDKIINLISQETLDELDRFKNDLTSGPPELRELFEKGGPRVLL